MKLAAITLEFWDFSPASLFFGQKKKKEKRIKSDRLTFIPSKGSKESTVELKDRLVKSQKRGDAEEHDKHLGTLSKGP